MQKIVPDNAMLIPENAEIAFKGKVFDVYQWPQTMFDGSTKTFEMIKRPDTVQVIVAHKGKILLVEDEQPGRAPRIHLPGGRVDPKDESWEAAARRELREETGVVCKNWKLIEVGQPIIKAEWFIPIFLATGITDKLPQQLDADGEKIVPLWQDFKQARENVLLEGEQTMQYLVSFFNKVGSLEELFALKVFEGIEVDR